MSHEIETMAYAGATPWHKIGTYVGEEAVDGPTMLEMANLDREIATMPLFTCSAPKDQGGKLIKVEGHVAIIRLDDSKVMGTATDTYSPLQTREALTILDGLVSDGSMRYHTAGSLYGGKKVWVLGKIGSAEIVPNDRIDNYILLYTGHDGSTATRVLWTQVRVVCANTARAALTAGAGEGMTVRHTSNQKTRLATAGRILGIAQSNLENSVEFLRRSAAARLTEERWVKLAGELIPDPEKGNPSRAQAKRQDLTRLLFRGRGQDIPISKGIKVSDTLWGARNAVTEYVNYHRQAKGDPEAAQERRFDSSLWGSSASFVAKADELIAEMLDTEPEADPVDAMDLMGMGA